LRSPKEMGMSRRAVSRREKQGGNRRQTGSQSREGLAGSEGAPAQQRPAV